MPVYSRMKECAVLRWCTETTFGLCGFSHDSSSAPNRDRTIDRPFDETCGLSAAYAWNTGKQLDSGPGATLLYFGEGKPDTPCRVCEHYAMFSKN